MANSFEDEIRSLADRGNMTGAVQHWRTVTGADLPSALASVELFLQNGGGSPVDDPTNPSVRHRQATARFSTGLGNAEQYEPGMIWLGRSESDSSAVGFSDDRHIVTIAGSRAGKGASAIIPNLCEYPGSLICIDPKGENATVTAMRRANGSAFCHGIGQQVAVLDPFGVADVPEELQAAFNPMNLVDIEGLDAVDEAKAIAEALILIDDPKEMHWVESAKQFVAALVLYAKVNSDPEHQHLPHVRDLLTRGFPVPAPEDGSSPTTNGFDEMLKDMRERDECGGVIAAAAETLAQMGPEERGGVLSFARRNTSFLDSPRMRNVLRHSTMDLADLKRRANGMSIFICLPVKELGNHGRWMRLVVMMGMAQMEKLGHKRPASGHPVLFLLDEFASLGYMRPIEVAAAYIAGYGVKLWMVLQDLQQLQGLYEKSWATFLGNAGVLQCFANSDQPTLDYISKRLGDVEMRQITRSRSRNESRTVSNSESTAQTTGSSSSTSSDKSVTRRPKGLIFLGKKTSESHSRGTSQSFENSSTTTTGKDTSYTDGQDAGISEIITVAPLMRPDEIERRFNRASMLQLVIVSGDYPVVLARSNYFDDPFFDSKFDPHPAHPEHAPLTLEEKARRARALLEEQLAFAYAESERKEAELDKVRQQRGRGDSKRTWLKRLGYGVGALLAANWVIRIAGPSTSADTAPPAASSVNTPSAPPTQAKAVPTPAAPAPVQQTAPSPYVLAVAAVAANLRSEPTERGNRVATLQRGDQLAFLARAENHVRVSTISGAEGWISDRLIITSTALNRLRSLSTDQYIESQGSFQRLQQAYDELKHLLPILNQAQNEMALDSPDAINLLSRIDTQRSLTIKKDMDAAKWFGINAEYEEKLANFPATAANALAAMVADPTNPEHLNRYCFAHYQLDQLQPLQGVAPLLPLLAPLSTNTWLITGFAQSSQDKQREAITSLRYAIKLSRNEAFTRRYFQELADKARDQRIGEALRSALMRT